MSKYKQPTFQRIIDNVIIDQITKCWEWTRGLNHKGYGLTSINNKTQIVHRIMYKYFYGDIPEDKPFILHNCDNPKCCNPIHLYAGTNQDNMIDRAERNPDSWTLTTGEKNGQSKLTEKQIIEIRASKDSQRTIAKRFNISKAMIYYIQKRKNWKHI